MNSLFTDYFIDYLEQDNLNFFIQIGFIMFDIVTFISLLFLKAEYGRHNNRSEKWLIVSDTFAWIFQEFPTLAISMFYTLNYFLYSEKINYIKFIFISFYNLHYIHRTLIYPFKLLSKSKKMPIDIVIMAFTFNIFNATMINRSIFLFSEYNSQIFFTRSFYFGSLLYFLGMFINLYHDYYILNEKKKRNGNYFIPKSFLFNYISCPNYLGEIIEWIGFAIASQNSCAFLFAISTFSNLFPRALTHNEWYRAKFKEYPNNIKAIIPYLI